MLRARRLSTGTVLREGAQVVIIGGGPAGTLFAIHLLRRARQLRKNIRVAIIEKKREPTFCGSPLPPTCREGCNYCAGGISPRMADALSDMGLSPPESLVQGEVRALTIQSEWKNIELALPAGRRMFSVFRGSRPMRRSDRHVNFDSFLLHQAVEEGSVLISGEAYAIRRDSGSGLTVSFWTGEGPLRCSREIEADFLALAAGVNERPGARPQESRLALSLRQLMPEFRAPKVRKALIFELEADRTSINLLKNEVCFGDYGSRDLRIEMSSLLPKGRFITGVLIGPTIDRAHPMEYQDIVRAFMELPHVRRLVPRMPALPTACMCSPNMAVGTAGRPYGDRIAVIGDLAVSRLYKDGIYSAHLTAGALAQAVLTAGIDRDSLHAAYWPVVRRLRNDNLMGRVVYFFNRTAFSRPWLSRIVYQAVLSERKSMPQGKRLLESILWKVASGDDSYARIIASMFHPTALWMLVVGGLFVTLRNHFVEMLFGLSWKQMARFPTGVYRESREAKRRELSDYLGPSGSVAGPFFERMYSIRIKADRNTIWRQLGKFGSAEREYLKPRLMAVTRTSGNPNEVGSVVEYSLLSGRLRFALALERAEQNRRLVYRVLDGFPQGGILVFDIETLGEEVHLLTIYAAFEWPRNAGFLAGTCGRLFRATFPAFVHDVIWNHALCKLKEVAEGEVLPASPAGAGQGTGAAHDSLDRNGRVGL